jgi:uncharacterized protein (TIRG00374 family)
LTSLRWLPRLIGPCILAYFLLTTDLSRIALNLREVHWAPLVLSLALLPAFAVVKAWRWKLLMRSLGMAAPALGSTMRLYIIGLFLGGATPGQSGDFLKAWYLRDRGEPLGAALFSILLDRLFDFMIMAVVSLAGVAILLQAFPADRRSPIEAVVVTLALGVAALILVLIARRPRETLMRGVAAAAPTGMQARVERWRAQFAALELRPGVLGAVLAATVASATVSVVRLWLLFQALEIVIPAAALISSVALISILQTVPISFSGVGVRDAVLVATLGGFGYSADKALALSALFLLLNLENIVVGFLVSVRTPSVRRGAGADAGAAPRGAA